MFNTFYGLTFNPFNKSISEADVYLTTGHQAMITRLNYLKDTRGIGVFTSSSGMGKTFALRCFAKSLNPNLFQMAYLCLSTVSVSEFYRQFCTALGLETNAKKTVMFDDIKARLLYLYKEKRKTFLVAIDEAQYLNTGILRDLKMLMNAEYDSLDCFSLILVGQPHLGNILEKPVHEALKQRILVHYNYDRLSPEEAIEYIYSRIELAGGARSILDETAAQSVASFSQGVPRIINSIMTNAIIIGAQIKQISISSELILSASADLSLRN